MSGLKPAVAISPAQAQLIVDRAVGGRRVTRVSEVEGGAISTIFEIRLADGPPHLMLKVYPESLRWKMQKEVAVARLLQGNLGVAVPRILWSDDSKSLLDLNYLVMEKIENDGTVRSLGPSFVAEERSAVYCAMGSVLREIHRIPMHAFGYVGAHGVLTPRDSNRAYMMAQFGRKLAEFRERGRAAALADRLEQIVAEGAHLLEACREPRLCHYDFHGGNMLVRRSGGRVQVAGLVDLENALAGDPLLDLAKATLDQDINEDPSKRADLLTGYGPIDRDDWQGTLTLYRMYCVLEFWCWLAQIGNHTLLATIGRQLEGFATEDPGRG